MKVLTIPDIKKLDQYTVTNEPISSFNLMNRAAYKCFSWLSNHLSSNSKIGIICGPGNNGGDGIAIASLLKKNNYNVNCYIVNFENRKSQDNQAQEALYLTRYKAITIQKEADFEKIKDDIIVDALFGSGLSRALVGSWAKIANYINALECKTIAIDCPSGLFMDCKTPPSNPVIKAGACLSLQMAKKAMLIAESAKLIGDLHIIDIGLSKKGIELMDCSNFYLCEEDIKPLLKKRFTHSHKGNYGHALLVGGSKGKVGAAVLMAKACLRTGVGLLTVHSPKCGYNILQTAIPEAMVQCDRKDNYISKATIHSKLVIGIGPGISEHPQTTHALSELLDQLNKPILLDADALNIIASHRELISKIPKNSILTPHKKEAERLLGEKNDDWELWERVNQFAISHQVYIVLKGTHSQIHCPDGRCYFNSTGNPGMATAGSGDVLSGMITSLLAQKYSPENAAKLGVYLHGLAGDIMATKMSEESLCASDIVDGISLAYKYLKAI